AHPVDGRPVRQAAAESERRADPARGAVEIRFQGHQVHRPGGAHRKAAAHDVEPRRAERIRLLCERESGGGSPPPEPGDPAPNRGAAAPKDAALQRLRRAGGQPVFRDESSGELLSAKKSIWSGPLPWLKPAVLLGSLAPAIRLLVLGAGGELGANPIATALN